MENKIYTSLLGLLLALPLSMSGAAEPVSNTIILKTNDGQEFTVPKEIALLSKTIKHQIEDHPTENIFTLEKIDGATVKKLLPLMELAHSKQREPLKERIQSVSDKISSSLAEAQLPQWHRLVINIYLLDIEILKAPLADGMIKYISKTYYKKDAIEDLILNDLTEPDEFKGLLAKYWYLNKELTLPRVFVYAFPYSAYDFLLPQLDYGFSIEELVSYDKLFGTWPECQIFAHHMNLIFPGITEDCQYHYQLHLECLRINDLTGLMLIPEIGRVSELNLSRNRLTTLPEDVFDGMNNLRKIDFSYNPLKPGTEKKLKAHLGDRVTFEWLYSILSAIYNTVY